MVWCGWLGREGCRDIRVVSSCFVRIDTSGLTLTILFHLQTIYLSTQCGKTVFRVDLRSNRVEGCIEYTKFKCIV